MIDFLKKIYETKIKNTEVADEKTIRKKRLKKNVVHLIVLFLLVFLLPYFSRFIKIDIDDVTNSSFMNENIKSFYEEYQNKQNENLSEPNIEPSTDLLDIETTTDKLTSLKGVYDKCDIVCKVNEVFEKTILVVNTKNENNILVKIYGLEEFDSNNTLPSHKEYMNSLLNSNIGLIFIDDIAHDYVFKNDEIVDAYIVLPNGKILNLELLELGYAHIDEDINNKDYETFIKSQQKAKDNKVGYWAQ